MRPVRRRPSTLVNLAFAPQRVTGQQRYAREIADRVLADPDTAGLEPQGWWRRSGSVTWAWSLTLLPWRARGRVLLSLTARSPAWFARHVLVVHDLFVLTNPEWYSRAYVWTHAPLLRLQLRTAAALVAVSEPVAEQIAHYGVPVSVAPNAPSEVFAAPAPADAPDPLPALGLERGRYLLAVGSADPRKNLRMLARAYAGLTEAERAEHPLVLAGGAAAIYRAEEIGWPAGVVDAGYVSDDDLRALYAGSLAVVFVSLAEGFGLPLVEAAAAGARRLVISDLPVFRWICGEGAHYVDPCSEQSITAGLREAITQGRELGIDLDRFTWERSAEVVAAACAQVAAAPSR